MTSTLPEYLLSSTFPISNSSFKTLETSNLAISINSKVSPLLIYSPLQVNQPSTLLVKRSATSRDELQISFGSKKGKQSVSAKKQDISDTRQDITSTALFNAIPIHEKPTDVGVRNGPPLNIDATDPKLVYSMLDLIPERLLDVVDIDILSDTLKEQVESNCNRIFKSRFVLDLITQHVARNEKTHLKTLIYLLFMMKFHSSSPSSLGKRSLIPKRIYNHLIESFTQQETTTDQTIRYLKTDALWDKLRLYIFAICLKVMDNKCPVDSLAKDLGLGIKRAALLFRELGCRVDSVGNSRVAVLVLPLEFPKRTR